MYDMLPFPHITATRPEEQVAQINSYLIQFKETLEFILANISVDNLSQDLVDKLNSLGTNIEKSSAEREEEIQQVTSKIVTVADVINSPALQADLDARMDEVEQELQQRVDDNMPTASEVLESFKLTVNYDTGHLEY